MNMEWHDIEEQTPSIRSLLYGRGGVLFEEHAAVSDYDAPEQDFDDDFSDERV
jgi:hypothetical protein